MNSKKRYEIVIPALSITRNVYPNNDKEIDYTWDKSDDKIFYTKKLKNKLVFGNDTKNGIDDFTFFYNIEQDPVDRCSDIYLNIYKICKGVEQIEYQSVFSLNDGEWNLDRCLFSVKPDSDSDYECLKKAKNKETNILELPNIITTRANLDYNYEFYVFNSFGGLPTYPGVQTSVWTLFFQNLSTTYTEDCTTAGYSIKVYYREYVITACVGGVPSPPPGSGWLLETNNCGTSNTAKYVRTPVAGTLPAIATNNIFAGWYNPVTGLDELPPQPASKSIIVSNTPASEDLLYKYTTIVRIDLPGQNLDWKMEVPNNPNSTYAWSLDGTSPLPATITGAANVVTIRPTTIASGQIIVKLMETHGNAYVSTKLYTINVVTVGSSNTPYSLTLSNIIVGVTNVCKSQTDLKFSLPEQPVLGAGGLYTAAITSIVWSVTGGATITAGQGTRNVTINAGTGNFTVSATWSVTWTNTSPPGTYCTFNFSTSKVVTVAAMPVTDSIFTIINRYPSEPGLSMKVLARTGATYSWYNSSSFLSNGTLSSGYNQYTFTTPASVGTYCYLVKEDINCAGCTWIKLSDSENTPGFSPPWPKFPPVYWCYNPSSTSINYTRGRLFQEAAEYVLAGTGCGFSTIYSDFFGWNPIGDAPGYVAGMNYVTGATNKLLYLTIHQKSDVLNPTSSNAATKGTLTFAKLAKIWLEVFDCFYFIDTAGRFRVEHRKYFNNTLAYDSTISPNATYNTSKRIYTYLKEQMPQRERFKFSEVLYTDFIGADIYYNSVCVNQDPESNISERGVNDIMTTDLYALFIDPSNANKTGFVLMCNDFDGTDYSVSIELGQISGAIIANAHLSWANLHNNYHRYNRVLKQGFMNGIFTTFVTAKKTKQQKDIVLQLCCDEDFDPTFSLIKTELGNGQVETAEQSTKEGTIKLTLLHD